MRQAELTLSYLGDSWMPYYAVFNLPPWIRNFPEILTYLDNRNRFWSHLETL